MKAISTGAKTRGYNLIKISNNKTDLALKYLHALRESPVENVTWIVFQYYYMLYTYKVDYGFV